MKELLRRRFFSLSLRSHLLLLASLLALPSVALIIHSGFRQRNDALDSGFAQTRRLAYSIATEQYNMTGDIEQLLTVLAQLPEVKTHNGPAAQKILSDVYRKSGQYGNIVIAKPTGEIWASALPTTGSLSVKEKRSFLNALGSRHFSSGEFAVGRISALPSIGFAYPMIDQKDRFAGTISANVNFGHLKELIVQAGLPRGSAYCISDYKGIVIARNLNPEKTVGLADKSDLFLRMKQGPQEDSFIGTELGGEKRIISYRKLRLPREDTPYLYIRASIPLEEVLKAARLAQFVNIAVLTGFLLAALLLSVSVANYCFVGRIKILRESSQRIARGNFEVRVSDLIRGGELGDLGWSLDEMARQLKEREAELNHLNRGLTKRVAEEIERRLVHERLLARHARLAAIGEMIGAIAHQWRQPLAIVGATVQSVKMAWKSRCLDTSFLDNAVSDVQTQLLHMSETIEHFRRFFSPEKVVESFDLRGKIQEVMQLVAPRFANSAVTLEFVDRTPGLPLAIRGYQNEFKQALINLIGNSFDAIVDAESGDRPTGMRGLVTISLHTETDKVVIGVRDNGGGIPEEYADKIFEPYFTSKPADKGTGIGLYMSRLIVEESMGGRLRFTSGAEGTLFRMEFPKDVSTQGGLNG